MDTIGMHEWDRAWELRRRADDRTEVVYAPHYRAARAQFDVIDGATYADVDVTRAPQWDRVAPTTANKLAAGWWFECTTCHAQVTAADFPARIVEGRRVFCDTECREKRATRAA